MQPQSELNFDAHSGKDSFAQSDQGILSARARNSRKNPSLSRPRPSGGDRREAQAQTAGQLQSEIKFDAKSGKDGFAEWVIARHQAAEEVANKLGLPLGHPVEVWLRGGIRLSGKLQLAHELLLVEEHKVRQLPLVVDGVTFTYSEMESCVRAD